MSFGVFQQLAPSALVDRSIFASFTASDVNDLVLIRGDYLEIYHLQRRQNRLSYALGQQLFGRCEALVAFRPDKGGSADHLALLFRRARYLVVLRYDPELGNIATCGQHVLIPSTESVLPEAFQPKLTVDPEQRCLLAHALPDRLVLFPTTKGSSLRPDSAQLSSLHQDDQSGLRAPFNIQAWSQLRLHHVTDVAFLGGYHQPTMACLGQAKPSWCGCISERSQESSVLIFVLDVTRQVRLIWATHGLPDDAFRILPMPPPISGVFSISPNSVTYLKEHGSSISQALNMAALERKALAEKSEKSSMRNESKLDILLADCSAVVLSPTVILFSIHPSGRLYLAHLVLTGRDAVTDIVWTSPAQHMPAWSMCCSRGEDFVCLVDTIGAVSLLRAQVSKKKLPGTLQPLKRMRLHEPGEVPLKPTEKLKELMDLHEQLRDAFRFLRSYTFERIDELPSTGPLQSLQLWCNDRGEENQSLGTQRFIACGGTDSKGSLQIMQRAVPLEEQVEFDLPKGSIFSAVWTLRQAEDPVIQGQPRQKRAVEAAAPPHRYVLISSAKRSMLLETTEEIEEISQSRGLEMAMSTVGAGSICDGKVLVQLTPKSAFFMRATPEAGAAPPSVPYPSKSSASGGSVADPFVLLRLEDKTIKLLTMTSATNTGQVVVRDLTTQLPEEIRGEVLWASLWKDLLVVLLPTQRGTVSVLQLHGGLGKPLTLREVFRSPHLGDVPPVLRSIVQTEEEDEDAKFNASLDYLRPITDVCATLPRSSVEVHLARQGDEKGAANVLSAELVDVDPDDEGPTLVLLVKGRPILFYRAMVARGPQGEKSSGAFPYSFSLVEHDFLGLVMDFDGAPYRPVSPLQDAVGRPSGAVCCAPHSGLPALWIGAKRNRFFIHPFPGKTYRGVAPLSAACVASGGFFSLLESDSGGTVAQVSSPATVEGLGSAGSFDLRQSIPCARLSIKKKPSWMATQGSEGLLGVAVSDMVVELNDVPAGPGMEEDPLSEDWSIIREAPVKVDAPPAMPRVHPRYELWIETSKELSKLGRYHFSFDNEEAVLSMSWVNLPGFPLSLAVGTGVNTGEDLTCRGRLMLFTIKDKEPGILPPVYQRSLRSPVTVVGQSGSNFIHAEGFKLYVEKWENSSFNKLALFDGSLCMTSMSNIKNFMLFGDLRKGVDFCQWKEEQSTGTRTIRRLSRSPPSMNMTVLACEFVIHQKSLGLVALDHKGNVHLYQYTPHSDGREGDQILRSCATFAMGAPCRSALRLQTEPGVQSLLMASGTGEVFCCRPIDDQAYRTITTLLGMLFTRLPFRCGLNPRAYRSDAQIHLLTPRKNIEVAPAPRRAAGKSEMSPGHPRPFRAGGRLQRNPSGRHQARNFWLFSGETGISRRRAALQGLGTLRGDPPTR